jgi:hypothetical protein
MMAVDIQPSNSAPAPDPAATPDLNGVPTKIATDTSSTIGAPSQPQPAPPPKEKEKFSEGWRRGASGEKYVVDSSGNVIPSRTTAPSAGGTFGSMYRAVYTKMNKLIADVVPEA